MHNLIGKWVPPNERSTFTSAFGAAFGYAIFYPAFGFILSVCTWEWIYHICGLLGIIWFILWKYYVYDSPSQHPNIHPMERAYIENSLGTTVQNDDILVRHFFVAQSVFDFYF